MYLGDNLLTDRHKVFVSYYDFDDKHQKDDFLRTFSNDIVSWSVEHGDIVSNNGESIMEQIRLKYLKESTVTVVLIGKRTWQRMYVDWEIQASLRHTDFSSRSGLLGILLPSYPGYARNEYNLRTIPPRLADNLVSDKSDLPAYANIIKWSDDIESVKGFIHKSYENRRLTPNNSRPMLTGNLSGDSW